MEESTSVIKYKHIKKIMGSIFYFQIFLVFKDNIHRFSECMGDMIFINGDARWTITVQDIMALYIKMLKYLYSFDLLILLWQIYYKDIIMVQCQITFQ